MKGFANDVVFKIIIGLFGTVISLVTWSYAQTVDGFKDRNEKTENRVERIDIIQQEHGKGIAKLEVITQAIDNRVQNVQADVRETNSKIDKVLEKLNHR